MNLRLRTYPPAGSLAGRQLLEVLAAASRYEVTVHDLVVATVDIPLACLR